MLLLLIGARSRCQICRKSAPLVLFFFSFFVLFRVRLFFFSFFVVVFWGEGFVGLGDDG